MLNGYAGGGLPWGVCSRQLSRTGMEMGTMEIMGTQLTGMEIAVYSAAAGVVVATLTLLVNMLWDALKQAFGKSKPRRCAACSKPAEPGSALCREHAQMSALIQRRRLT